MFQQPIFVASIFRHLICVCAGVLCAAGIAAQQNPQPGELKVLYTEHPGVPQNMVPGIPGATFYQFGGINRVRVSSSGVIGVQAVIELNGQFLDALLLNDRVVLKEGDPLPWAPSETLALIRDFDVSDSGSIAISLNSTGPSSTNSYLVREDFPNSWTVVAQSGNPIPDFPGKTYGTQYGATIDNSNRVGYLSDGVSGGLSSDQAIEFNALIVARTGLDAPMGQLSGLSENYGFFIRDYPVQVNGDGSRWLAQVNLETSNDEALVVDGTVALQAGYAIPGAAVSTPIAINGIAFSNFDRLGNWYAHGFFNPGNEYWAVSNGAILTRTGLPVFAGSSELWMANRTFPLVAGNGTDYVVAGVSASTFLSHLVRNNAEIISSKLDSIDLDENGQFDDGLVLQDFGEGYMLEDGGVIFLGQTRSTLPGGSTENSIVFYDNTPDPRLTVTGLIAGSMATIEVTPVDTGNLVYSSYSLAGGGPTNMNSPWGLLLVELTAPISLLPTMVGDSLGIASQQVPIPARAAGVSVWIQALEDEGAGTCQLTSGFAGIVQ